MAKPRMTEGYYTARERAIQSLAKVASEAEEVNHLGGLLMKQAADQFAGLFGTLEREIFEDCPRCHWPVSPAGDCENQKCRGLGEAVVSGPGAASARN